MKNFKYFKILTVAFLCLLGFTVAALSIRSGVATALTAGNFSPGHIIDDGIFEDSYSMSVQDIQNFLNSEVSCDTNGTQSDSYYYSSSTGQVNNSSSGTYVTTSRAVYGQRYATWWNSQTVQPSGYVNNESLAPYVCLPNYIENPTTGQNNLQNPNASISGGESAAQIIYNAAQEYQINPQVILTTLQKEQGLVTDDWPWTNEYTEAMGYSCPDGGGCSGYPGFYQQVSAAAEQYRKYMNNPNNYNYVVGNNTILYSPNCSSSSVVNIQNQATAALYDYTPYQPDSSTLSTRNAPGSNSGPGPNINSSDSCASYGNYNFWWYFNTWFGSSLDASYDWQEGDQTVYTDASLSNALGWNATLLAGQSAYVVVTAENDGNYTWTNTNNPVDLGTDSPEDRYSVFCTSAWLSCNRPARLLQSSVAPGGIGTFEFPVVAPNFPGIYNEHFNLVAEGLSWFNDPGMYISFNVQPDVYSWKPVNQTLYWDQNLTQTIGWNAALDKGQTIYAVVQALNTGNMTWYNNGSFPVRIATDSPENNNSLFCAPSWISCNRPATLEQSSVAPGQVGTFEFALKTPNTNGDFQVHFNLVIDGVTWFNDPGMYFDINLMNPNYAWKENGQYIAANSDGSGSLGWNATLQPNQLAYAFLNVVNISNFVWYPNSITPVRLGASHPNDRNSIFANGTWISPNRPATFSASAVYPGQSTTIEFPVQAPSTAGTYNEYFNMVQDGAAWFNDLGQYYKITVQ